MHRRNIFFLLVLCILAAGCSTEKEQPAQAWDNTRIISFAPSITETLFALGLGPKVVGVSNYCEYPPEAAALPRVGGLLDPNTEMAARLKPTCVIVHSCGTDIAGFMSKLNIPVLTVNGTTLQDIMGSFSAIGTPLGKQREAEKLTALIQERLDKIKPVQGKTIPKILLVIWRDAGSGSIRELQVAANDGYFSEIIKLAGGQIVPADTTVKFPSLNPESVLQLNPDFIIELLPEQKDGGTAAVNDWRNSLPSLPALRNNRIHVITDDYAVIPGPRFILLAEKLAQIIGK